MQVHSRQLVTPPILWCTWNFHLTSFNQNGSIEELVYLQALHFEGPSAHLFWSVSFCMWELKIFHLKAYHDLWYGLVFQHADYCIDDCFVYFSNLSCFCMNTVSWWWWWWWWWCWTFLFSLVCSYFFSNRETILVSKRLIQKVLVYRGWSICLQISYFKP